MLGFPRWQVPIQYEGTPAYIEQLQANKMKELNVFTFVCLVVWPDWLTFWSGLIVFCANVTVEAQNTVGVAERGAE